MISVRDEMWLRQRITGITSWMSTEACSPRMWQPRISPEGARRNLQAPSAYLLARPLAAEVYGTLAATYGTASRSSSCSVAPMLAYSGREKLADGMAP